MFLIKCSKLKQFLITTATLKKLPVNFLYVFSSFDKRYVKLNIEHNFEYFFISINSKNP